MVGYLDAKQNSSYQTSIRTEEIVTVSIFLSLIYEK